MVCFLTYFFDGLGPCEYEIRFRASLVVEQVNFVFIVKLTLILRLVCKIQFSQCFENELIKYPLKDGRKLFFFLSDTKLTNRCFVLFHVVEADKG